MTLTPDISNGFLLGTTGPDNDVLAPGQIASYPRGVLTLGGDDTIRGSSDNDLIDAGRGDDDIYGEGGIDTLTGGRNRDFIDGGLDNDLLRGGKGVDLLVGADGNDTLLGDTDVDIYKGGLGNDTFVFRRDQAGLTASAGIATIELPDAVITDFDKTSDFIALTGGLTEANLTFEPFSYGLNDPLVTLLNQVAPDVIPVGTQFLAKGGITPQDLDPNGDGVVNATYIRIAGSNQLLGAVLNVNATDLAGRFISSAF